MYPSTCTYVCILQAYSKCGSPKEAELLLQDIVVSDSVSLECSYVVLTGTVNQGINEYLNDSVICHEHDCVITWMHH